MLNERKYKNWGYLTNIALYFENAYLVLTLCGLALRSTRMTRPRVQRTSP